MLIVREADQFMVLSAALFAVRSFMVCTPAICKVKKCGRVCYIYSLQLTSVDWSLRNFGWAVLCQPRVTDAHYDDWWDDQQGFLGLHCRQRCF